MTSTALKTTHSDHAGGNRPWCGTCDSDEFLIFETAAFPAGGPAGELDVSYTCTECEGYYAHQVPAGALDPKVLAGILPVPGDEQPGIYTHCGEPMTLGRPAGRSVASEAAKNTGRRLLEVYLRTRVLHCRCGFQMELPAPGRPEGPGGGISMPLSDSERRRLRELESDLAAQDPVLARELSTGRPALRWLRRSIGLALTVAGIELIVMAMAARLPGIGFPGFILLLAGACVLLTRRAGRRSG